MYNSIWYANNHHPKLIQKVLAQSNKIYYVWNACGMSSEVHHVINIYFDPSSPRDALKHHFTSLKTDLIFLQPRVFERKFNHHKRRSFLGYLSAKNPKMKLPVILPAIKTAATVPTSHARSHTRSHCNYEIVNV